MNNYYLNSEVLMEFFAYELDPNVCAYFMDEKIKA